MILKINIFYIIFTKYRKLHFFNIKISYLSILLNGDYLKTLKISLKIFVFSLIIIALGIIGLYTYAYLSPSIDLKNTGNLYIYDNANELVYQGSKSSEWVDLQNISDYFINAIISVEDKNFYSHMGFDYLRILKAAINNIQSSSLSEGGSTITQQYAKNMYLDFDKTWSRKIEEAFLALELEVHYDKDSILEGYVNTIYYGHGNYGIQNASKYYFNKDASQLTLEEALILAGIPNRPNEYNPVTDYESSIYRAKIVAETMINNNMLTWDEYNNLFTSPIEIYGKNTENNLQMLMYYQDAVIRELESINVIPPSLIESGGLKIYTTLDMNYQKIMEENILEHKVDDNMQVASVIVDPNNGKILALSGGINYADSTYNRAIDSVRQVGSTMKTFLYYAALENNLTMASTFKSEPTVFNLSNDQVYSPNNYNNIYANKDITMAAALAYSDNIYAVKTNLFLGVDKMIEAAKKTGIKGELNEVASLALGTSELNIIDLVTGYTTFASGGYERDLHFIEKVEDMNGNVLYEKEYINNLVLNPNYTYIINEMLAGTTSSTFNDYTTATGYSISHILTNKYALKSGTTDTDNWHIGYNNEVLFGIWMGYDNNQNTTSQISSAQKNIWAQTMEDINAEAKDTWYEKPDNVVGVLLDSVTGTMATDETKSSIFYFIKGTEPGASSYVNANP